MNTHPFIAQLADICRVERTRAKWVVVPSYPIGLTVGERLVRDAGAWANVRFVTPLDLATRMAAPYLVERGIDPSGEDLGPALVMRLLLELPEEGGYFRPMAAHTSMATALWRTIRELRYAGVRAADLAARPFTTLTGKQHECVALQGAYERHLESARVADIPAVLEEAGRHADWSPIAAGDLVLEFPCIVWPPAVRRFLDGLPGRKVRPQTLTVPGLVVPDRVVALSPSIETLDTHRDSDASRLRFLLAPREAGEPKKDGSLEIICAGGREAEIDEIFRRAASSNLPLDQVEIVCSAGVQPSMVWEKSMRLGWPVTLSPGLPAAMTRSGRLLLRLCDWIDSGYEAAELRRLLLSGDLVSTVFDAVVEADTRKPAHTNLSPGQAARLLLKAEATWGRDTYSRALTRTAEEYARRANDPEVAEPDRDWSAKKASQARALLSWVEAVLLLVPDADRQPDRRVPLLALASGAALFVETYAGQASAVDGMSRTAVVAALHELRALGEYRCDLETGVRFLRERVESLAVGRDRPRPGHIHVSTLYDGGHDGRPLVFVAGLEESAVFPAAVEDPALLDVERTAIGCQLPTSSDRQSEAVTAVVSRLAALGASAEKVCLSYSCRDTREYRETFPSWIVLQAFRIQQGDPALTYDDLSKHFVEPSSTVPDLPRASLTEAGWWLAARQAPRARQEILAAFPSLARGLEGEAAREGGAFTAFDGFVPEAGEALDPSRTGRAVSATTLEDAAACPFRFFLRQGLGVRPIEEGRQEDDVWLAPTTKGTELHALFARIMRAVRAEKRRPSLEVDQPRLRQWGRERLDELRAEMPPPSDEVFARESRNFLEDLDAFIEAECEGRHGRDAIGFEVPFGFANEDSGEALAMDDPLIIEVDRRRKLSVHGWIDRVNRLAPGQYEVADYKSSYWADSWKGTFAGGTRLQHALYGAAAERSLRRTKPDARVVRGTYLFPTLKGHRQRKEIAAPATAELRAVLRDLLDTIGAGAFLSADDEERCKWCEFKPACREGSTERARLKLADESAKALKAYTALRGHQ